MQEPEKSERGARWLRMPPDPERLRLVREAVEAARLPGEGQRNAYLVVDPCTLLHRDKPEAAERLRADPSRPVIELPLRAERVFVKTNIRICGLGGDRARTAKIALFAASRGMFRREIRGRRLLERRLAGQEMQLPGILDHDRARGAWLVEEHVRGHVCTPEEFVDFLGAAVTALYAATARLRPMRGSPVLLRALRRAPLADLGVPHARLLRDGLWPVALIHGDLLAHNIIVTPGRRFCLVDWEATRVSSIADDLCTFFLKSASRRPRIMALLGELSGPRAMPARTADGGRHRAEAHAPGPDRPAGLPAGGDARPRHAGARPRPHAPPDRRALLRA